MEQEILNMLKAQEELLRQIYISSEKTRRYFLWMLWGTILLFVLPLIGLLFAIPSFLGTYKSMLAL